MFDFEQDFDKKKAKRDEVLAGNKDDDIDAKDDEVFADLFPKDETKVKEASDAVPASTDGTNNDTSTSEASKTQGASQATKT